MATIEDCSTLVSFDQQLDNVELMLQKADKYNERLAVQIDHVKNLVQANQSVLGNLEANEDQIKQLFGYEGKVEIDSKMHKNIHSIKKKLFHIVSLLDGFGSESSDCIPEQGTEQSWSNQISELSISFVSIGNELKLMSEGKLDATRDEVNLSRSSCKSSSKKATCWTRCKSSRRINWNSAHLDALRKATESLTRSFSNESSPTLESAYRNHIMEKAEKILDHAEQLNLKSKTLMKIKLLSRLMLKVLAKQKELHVQNSLNELTNEILTDFTSQQLIYTPSQKICMSNPYLA